METKKSELSQGTSQVNRKKLLTVVMVYLFRCLCMNVTLHLAKEPEEAKDKKYPAVLEEKWESIGYGDLSLAGVQLVRFLHFSCGSFLIR